MLVLSLYCSRRSVRVALSFTCSACACWTLSAFWRRRCAAADAAHAGDQALAQRPRLGCCSIAAATSSALRVRGLAGSVASFWRSAAGGCSEPLAVVYPASVARIAPASRRSPDPCGNAHGRPATAPDRPVQPDAAAERARRPADARAQRRAGVSGIYFTDPLPGLRRLPSAPAGAPTGTQLSGGLGQLASPAPGRRPPAPAGLLLPGGGLLLLLRQLVAAGQPLELLLLALLLGQQGFSSSVSTCKLSCSACCWASVNRTMPAAGLRTSPAHGERLCAVRRPWLKSGRRFPCRSAPPAAPRDRSASRSGRRQIAPKAASSG